MKVLMTILWTDEKTGLERNDSRIYEAEQSVVAQLMLEYQLAHCHTVRYMIKKLED